MAAVIIWSVPHIAVPSNRLDVSSLKAEADSARKDVTRLGTWFAHMQISSSANVYKRGKLRPCTYIMKANSRIVTVLVLDSIIVISALFLELAILFWNESG